MARGRELRALTGLRGVAAIYVVVFHYFIGIGFTNPATTLLAHGYLAVDLFFVLSGFVMALTYGAMFRAGWTARACTIFLGRRLARIYPLYLAGTLVGGVLVWSGQLENSCTMPLPDCAGANLLMVQAWGLTGSLDGPGWSISAEWAAYLVFPLLVPLCLFGRTLTAWVAAAVCSMVLLALVLLPDAWAHRPAPGHGLDLHSGFGGLSVVRCLAEFALGMLAFRLREGSFVAARATGRKLAPAICMALLALLALPRTDLLIVALFPMLVLSLVSECHLPGRLLSSAPALFLGRLSYSLYLTHELMGGLMGSVHKLAKRHGLAHAQSYAALLGILLSIPCAYAGYRLIEVPGRRWVRGWLEGRALSRPGIEPMREAP